MKIAAQTEYQIESLIYAIAVGYMGKKAKKPEKPAILRRSY